MNLSEVYTNHPEVKRLTEHLSSNADFLQTRGLAGSSFAFIAWSVFSSINRPMVCVFPDKETAAYFFSDMEAIGASQRVVFFPSGYRRKLRSHISDTANIVLRNEVLQKLEDDSKSCIIVTYPEAVAEKVVNSEVLHEKALKIHQGEKLSADFIKEVLFEYGFELTDFVYRPGQYAVRGSIIDVFSFSSEYPYRIDFFGDEVDSLRSFEVENQLSIERFDHIVITPDFRKTDSHEISMSLFERFKKKPVVWVNDLDLILGAVDSFLSNSQFSDEESEEIVEIEKQLFFDSGELKKLFFKHQLVENVSVASLTGAIAFDTKEQPVFNKNFDFLIEHLLQKQEEGYTVYIAAENEKQTERLESIFADMGYSGIFNPLKAGFHKGFSDSILKLAIYTDHQIFERYHRYKLREDFIRSESITLNEFYNLHPGDYVVHVDHGIGVFGGLERIEINGKVQEQIRLVYKDKDLLYVNLHSLHKISKYKGKDGDPPVLSKLGTGAWSRLKQKTKSKVKDIARELIALYAERLKQKGYSFGSDTYLQKELEASFLYEDTPDQEKTTKSLKKDMESDIPMDRLVCGDVGFGKTEIAIRAAFKAVNDSKQVAVLVPTTILALQHYYTFSGRLQNFPCKVEYISRLRKSADQREILKKLKGGSVDIIIGTHKLLGKDVEFKDLGLLVVDEEQKFGVAAKEKLRTIKVNVDTLTLTATPIPRTLQFSLMGARDLSVINTPPPNRQPVQTEVHTFNEDVICDAIMYEVGRNGQVFFIHNRVQNIGEVEAMINRLCPAVRTVIGHGQMDPQKLETIMLDFIEGVYDVLIATTIIENGLDIPNANTIIINEAHHFGLSDLHQLRGRVGRSNRKAFCYLLAPPVSVLSQEARRRLKAIEQFSDLGSGFNIAMQDLDIRGAGNLLGGEQSGFIADIGFDTYQKILQEAVEELREDEFKGVFPGDDMVHEEMHSWVKDCQVETDLEVYLPEWYIENITERIKLYRELDAMVDDDAIEAFKIKLTDRFGSLPKQAQGLFAVVRLRRLATTTGFEKIILKNSKMHCYFISKKESGFYQSALFGNILQYLQTTRKGSALREVNEKLVLVLDGVKTIDQALAKLTDLVDAVSCVSH